MEPGPIRIIMYMHGKKTNKKKKEEGRKEVRKKERKIKKERKKRQRKRKKKGGRESVFHSVDIHILSQYWSRYAGDIDKVIS